MITDFAEMLMRGTTEQQRDLQPLAPELMEWLSGKGLTLKQAAILLGMTVNKIAAQAGHQINGAKVTPRATGD